MPLQDARVHYFGQFIAVVVAETYEQARAAAALLKVEYQKLPVAIELEKELPKGFKAKIFFGVIESEFNEGDAAGVITAAPVKVERTYRTSMENHHPMEPHASIAVWAGEKLKIYDAVQGLKSSQGKMASILGLQLEQVQIISKFVGGGFGGKGGWMYPVMAAMAARVVKRPVKIVLTRQMMQTNVGRRGATAQHVTLAAGRCGKLTAIRHLTDTYTNLLQGTPPNPNEYFEASGLPTKVLYGAPNREIGHKVARLKHRRAEPDAGSRRSVGRFRTRIGDGRTSC